MDIDTQFYNFLEVFGKFGYCTSAYLKYLMNDQCNHGSYNVCWPILVNMQTALFWNYVFPTRALKIEMGKGRLSLE